MIPEDESMRRALVFATEALEPLVGLARDAERAGFDRVWTTEYLQRDAVARALAIALGTDTIGVGTGIAYAFTRLPVAMAALAADVQRLAEGRFALGLGTGTRGVRRWYGAEFDPPARQFAAYADELRKTWAGMPGLADTGAPPIFGAGLNPVMTRTAVRAGDGVLLHPLALVRTHLQERLLPAIRKGCQDREAGTFVAVWAITSIAADEEVAREHARRQVAFYLSTPSYGSVVEGTPWASVAGSIRDAFDGSGRRATWDELAPLVPDSLIDEIALVGTPETVAGKATLLEEELRSHGIDELVFQTVGAGLDEEEVVHNCAEIIAVLGRSPSIRAEATVSDADEGVSGP
jgi:alkanesulfonate monooxygenase SsuD/methylene tetrahydromethanopterin reductase-like flavin-dependent oxidoreductase (luciferase family)